MSKCIPALIRFNNGDTFIGTSYGKSDQLSPWIFSFDDIISILNRDNFDSEDVFNQCEVKDKRYEEEHRGFMKYYPGDKDEIISDEEDVEIFIRGCIYLGGRVSRSKGRITSSLDLQKYTLKESLSPWTFLFYENDGFT